MLWKNGWSSGSHQTISLGTDNLQKLFFKSSLLLNGQCGIQVLERPQPAATTFAFPSVFIPLLWQQGSASCIGWVDYPRSLHKYVKMCSLRIFTRKNEARNTVRLSLFCIGMRCLNEIFYKSIPGYMGRISCRSKTQPQQIVFERIPGYIGRISCPPLSQP